MFCRIEGKCGESLFEAFLTPMKKISVEEFEQSDITFDGLTYEKMVQLWCVSDIPDSVIAMKCGVSKEKIARLRRDKYKINMMNSDEHRENVSNARSVMTDMTLREEANAIVAHVFRNGFLEDLHAGIVEEKLLDPKYSRITNDEMKKLMIECCDKMEKLLRLREEKPSEYMDKMKRTLRNYCKHWEK